MNLSVGNETVTQWLFSWSTWINSPVWTENMFNTPRVVSSKALTRGNFLNSIVYAKFIDSSDSHLFSMISLCIALLNFWFTRCLFLASIFFVPTISSSSSFTNFYKLTTSVMKELNNQGKHILQSYKPLYMTVSQRYKMKFLLCKRSWHFYL